MIRRNITYKEKGLIVPLHKAIVRPHLDHDFTIVKGQNRLDFRKYSFPQMTVNEWDKF